MRTLALIITVGAFYLAYQQYSNTFKFLGQAGSLFATAKDLKQAADSGNLSGGLEGFQGRAIAELIKKNPKLTSFDRDTLIRELNRQSPVPGFKFRSYEDRPSKGVSDITLDSNGEKVIICLKVSEAPPSYDPEFQAEMPIKDQVACSRIDRSYQVKSASGEDERQIRFGL